MEKLCRICRTSDSVEDFCGFYKDPKLAADFFFITGIVIININSSTNPTLICSTCINSIKMFAKFKRKAQKSDIIFQQKYKFMELHYWTQQQYENSQEITTDHIKEEPAVYFITNIDNITENEDENDLKDEFSEVDELDCNQSDSDDESTESDKKNSRVECETCNKKLGTVRALKFHMKVVHNEDPRIYYCRHCPRTFKHVAYAKRHVKRNHNLSFLASRDVTVKAIKKSKNPNSFRNFKSKTCPFCAREFVKLVNCRNHLKIVHGTDQVVYNCRLCGLRFKIREYIRRHMRKKHDMALNAKNHFIEDKKDEIDKILEMPSPNLDDEMNFCSQCQQEFRQRQTFLNHMETVHGEGDSIYVCKFCLKRFEVLRNLKRHVKRAHNYKLLHDEVIVEQKTKRDLRKPKRKKIKKEKNSYSELTNSSS